MCEIVYVEHFKCKISGFLFCEKCPDVISTVCMSRELTAHSNTKYSTIP